MDHKNQKFSIYEISDLWEHLVMLTPAAHGVSDYGTGELYTALEVHLVSYIADHPNCTCSEIARDWNRTKGAISQIIKKLQNKDLIDGKPDPKNAKRIFLFLTPKGKYLDAKHRENDAGFWEDAFEKLEKEFSREEVDNAFSVMNSLYKIMAEPIKKDGQE